MPKAERTQKPDKKAKSTLPLPIIYTPDQYTAAAVTTTAALLKPSTRANYGQAVLHAQAWLMSTVEQERAREQDADPLNPSTFAFPPGYEAAFDSVPNQYSSKALEHFLLYKCVLTNKKGTDKPCGWQTGDRYYSALKNLWEFQ